MLHEKGQLELLNFLAVLCWTIWKSRNNASFNRINENPKVIVDWTHLWWCSMVSSLIHDQQQHNTVLSSPNWSSPPQGTLKINCDASFNSQSHNNIIAFLCRDSSGQIKHICSQNVHNHSTFQAELMALRKGIKFSLKFPG